VKLEGQMKVVALVLGPIDAQLSLGDKQGRAKGQLVTMDQYHQDNVVTAINLSYHYERMARSINITK
jgi:hypothetical protein